MMSLLGLLGKALGLGVIFVVTQYYLTYLRSPLKTVPGPLLAKFSNIWRFLNHYSQTHIESQRKLHERYGDLVRLGPTTVSVADASLLKTIYNTRGTFLKSEYYSVNDALSKGEIIQNMFSTRSNEFHARSVKPVQHLYSLQGAMRLEHVMDDNLRAFCSELEKRFMTGENRGKTCDIADWISYFAWDFLGDACWSKRIGFMEKGEDVGGMLETAERVMRYFSVVGQIPALDRWLGKNPYIPSWIYKFDDFSVAAGFAVERFMERMQDPKSGADMQDLLNDFLAAKEEFPNLVSDNEVIGYMIINILGGADTLAIIIKAIFYHLLKTTSAKSRLVAELRSASLTYPAPYSSIKDLPYLDACIKEGLRMHPVVGHILERIVPSTGLTLPDGRVLPPGTIVGANPWVIHYQKVVFGAEPVKFRPERWLQSEPEGDEEFEARIRKMKESDMSFGGGNRICLGKPVALVEVYKVIANIFGKYDVQLVDEEEEWVLHEQWFVWPHRIRVNMRSV